MTPWVLKMIPGISWPVIMLIKGKALIGTASLLWYCDTVSGKSKGQLASVAMSSLGGILEQIKIECSIQNILTGNCVWWQFDSFLPLWQNMSFVAGIPLVLVFRFWKVSQKSGSAAQWLRACPAVGALRAGIDRQGQQVEFCQPPPQVHSRASTRLEFLIDSPF